MTRFRTAALLAPVPYAAAQPSGKVIHMIVPFAAGGARELLARAFHNELGAALGQTIVLENRPGAGGGVGTAAVAKAVPDGQTLVFAGSSHNVAALISKPPLYDPIRDFAGVANIGMQSYVLMAGAEPQARSLAEFLKYAKAHPGKLNYSSAGQGSSSHLAMAYLVALAGVDMVHIPFKSTQDAITDVLAGRSHATLSANIGAMPYAKDARLRLLGVTSKKRSALLPGVPPIDEAVQGYEYDSWFGILALARTPRPVIERINVEVNRLLRDAVILERLAAQGVEPLPLSPAAFDELIRKDLADMAKVVKAAGQLGE